MYFSLTYIFKILFTLLVIYLFYKLIELYRNVLVLPPGPIPLPLIGNLLALRKNSHWSDVIEKYAKQYGPVITFWMGSEPFIFISDFELSRQTFNQIEFSGRIKGHLASILSNEVQQDLGCTDHGPTYLALRKVTVNALFKLSTNEKLPHLVSDCVEQTLNTIKTKVGFNKEFTPIEFTYQLFMNLMITNTFGNVYGNKDEMFEKTKKFLKEPTEQYGARFLLWEVSPLARTLDWIAVRRHRKEVNNLVQLITELFKSHYNDYEPTIERDLCDAIISAKNDALKNGKYEAPYLKDENLALCILDVLIGGIENLETLFNWMLLLITYYPEFQKMMRKEIEIQIGDRVPTHNDRKNCHLTMAFISEVFRCKNPSVVALPHKAMVTTKIGDYSIPKGTAVLFAQRFISMDEKHWANPQEFRPQRFLENDEYLSTGNQAYRPFGVGRRTCPGERLAIAEIFLVLVRFVQLTSDCELILGENQGLEPDPHYANAYSPKEFKILFKKTIK